MQLLKKEFELKIKYWTFLLTLHLTIAIDSFQKEFLYHSRRLFKHYDTYLNYLRIDRIY